MDALATVLLRRLGAVVLPAPAVTPAADGGAWTSAFEADLAARGWLLDAPLRRRLTLLDPVTRMRCADWVSAVTDEMVGADRVHAPLFRAFPDTPADPEKLYVERLLVHLLQAGAGPCVLCGVEGSVRLLDPCGHLVCAGCFDPAAYAGCPVCGRRLAAGDRYLPMVAPPRDEWTGRPRVAPVRLRRLTLDDAPARAAVELRDALVARAVALAEVDVADLATLVAATAPGRLDWLPRAVPARETLALVIAWALHATAGTDAYRGTVADAEGRWATVTDVARTLWAYSGGDPGLVLPAKPDEHGPGEAYRPVDEPRVTVAVPRVRALPRLLRRAVLSFVDRLDPVTAAEDLTRHPVVWKRLAERLHPFEVVTAQPNAAVAFAVLRGTRAATGDPLGRAMTAASGRRPDRLILSWHRDGRVSVRVRTFASLVEEAVAGGDIGAATALLGQRPGDLWRRVDHLLRLAVDDPHARALVQDAAARVAPRVSPTVLAGAAAQLHGRDTTTRVVVATRYAAAAVGDAMRLASHDRPGPTDGSPPDVAGPDLAGPYGPEPGTPRRTFFPRGDVVRTWTEPERRAPLPLDTITRLRAVVDAELAGRASRLDRFDVAVLDGALARVPAPMRERAGSGQLAGWPRGSVRPLADVEVLRLFLHWMDTAACRVDLDLSCAFYDERWEPVGHCDYTRLRFGGDAAIHSGDLTSAPAPRGATEFVDLDRAALAAEGVRWAVPVVLSYNDVPFDGLSAAFAGLSLPVPGGAQFDASRVLQKFGLRGAAKSSVPMIVDVPGGELMWVDASLSTRGYGHSVGPHSARLGRVSADLWEHFRSGGRATVLDVVAWHAVARADVVVVRHADGTTTTVTGSAVVRRDPAAIVAEIRAVAAAGTGGARTPVLASRRVLAATLDADGLAAIVGADVAAGSTALLVDGRAGAPWSPVTASDLTAGLIPVD